MRSFMFPPQLQRWPTRSWRPCCPIVTSSCSMWEILMNTRLDVFQMLSTSHVSLTLGRKLGKRVVFYGSFLSYCFCRVCKYQWVSWRSLWSCPQSDFNRNLKWGFLGKMMTTSCFTAEVETEVPKHFLLLVSWDLAGKSSCTCIYTRNISSCPITAH